MAIVVKVCAHGEIFRLPADSCYDFEHIYRSVLDLLRFHTERGEEADYALFCAVGVHGVKLQLSASMWMECVQAVVATGSGRPTVRIIAEKLQAGHLDMEPRQYQGEQQEEANKKPDCGQQEVEKDDEAGTDDERCRDKEKKHSKEQKDKDKDKKKDDKKKDDRKKDKKDEKDKKKDKKDDKDDKPSGEEDKRDKRDKKEKKEKKDKRENKDKRDAGEKHETNEREDEDQTRQEEAALAAEVEGHANRLSEAGEACPRSPTHAYDDVHTIGCDEAIALAMWHLEMEEQRAEFAYTERDPCLSEDGSVAASARANVSMNHSSSARRASTYAEQRDAHSQAQAQSTTALANVRQELATVWRAQRAAAVMSQPGELRHIPRDGRAAEMQMGCGGGNQRARGRGTGSYGGVGRGRSSGDGWNNAANSCHRGMHQPRVISSMVHTGPFCLQQDHVHIVGSTITGPIRLSHSRVHFEQCIITGRIEMEHTQLILTGGMLTGNVSRDQGSTFQCSGMHTGQVS